MKDNCGFKCPEILLENILGRKYMEAVKIAYQYLMESSVEKLRKMVGKKLDFIPDFDQLDKKTFVESYQKPIKDDILAGYKLFKVTESKELQIDWTSGHYQLPLGYHYPIFDDLITKARRLGIVDDTHNNTPGMPVKLLAQELIRYANAYDNTSLDEILKSNDRLNRVTSVDTGTVAVSTGIKGILYRFREIYMDKIPVFIVQEGNYHGTDFFEQRLRSMWEWLFANVIIEFVKPNDTDSLISAFQKYENSPTEKVCTVMIEPILMNNRAIYLQPGYVHKAKELCDQYNAVLFLDEIQTCMWSPKVFMSNEYGGVADVLAIGKGLTAGYSPLAYTVCKCEIDNQSQYSSISTNGNADMAALAGLIVLEIVKANSDHIEQVGNYYFEQLENLQRSYSDKITEITGLRHLAGINLADESLAGRFHQACLENGIFVRLQAYKEGASTIITKPPIIANFEDVDFVIEKFRKSMDSI